MSDKVYRKEGKKYVPISFIDWHGFPCDGIWMVKFNSRTEKSASCVSRLGDLPDPYPFYNMRLDADQMATAISKIWERYPSGISAYEFGYEMIQYLSTLNKPETRTISKPHKPHLKLPSKKKNKLN